MTVLAPRLAAFAHAYAAHREAEGRRLSEADLLELPWLSHGPQAAQWAVRARTFEAFVTRVLGPMIAATMRPLTVLDLGAGNGWLSYGVACLGQRAVALDIRADDVDGLGAAEPFVARAAGRIQCIVASFDAVPLPDGAADVAVFNASLHYATDLPAVLAEARRVTRQGGVIAILDSPFYRREADGAAMVAEKRAQAGGRFGERAAVLTSLPSIEFLTAGTLATASNGLALAWQRHRVRYPLGYELRPLLAALRRRRRPSRFDLWTAAVR
jgi:SAM-dependent methyltransferase